MAEIHDHLVDKRIQERSIRRGLLGKKDLEKHLESLPDVSNNAEVVTAPDPQGARIEGK